MVNYSDFNIGNALHKCDHKPLQIKILEFPKLNKQLTPIYNNTLV